MIVRQRVTRWGMSDKLGPVEMAPSSSPYLDGRADDATIGLARPQCESTATQIDTEVKRILQDAYVEAIRLLSERRHELDWLAEALLEHETLDEDQIVEVTGLQHQVLPLEAQLIASA